MVRRGKQNPIQANNTTAQSYVFVIVRVPNSRTGKDGVIRMENFLLGQPNGRAGVDTKHERKLGFSS